MVVRLFMCSDHSWFRLAKTIVVLRLVFWLRTTIH